MLKSASNRTKKQPSTTALTTKVDPTLRSAVERAATSLNISASELTRRALCDFLNRDDVTQGTLVADLGLKQSMSRLEERITCLEGKASA